MFPKLFIPPERPNAPAEVLARSAGLVLVEMELAEQVPVVGVQVAAEVALPEALGPLASLPGPAEAFWPPPTGPSKLTTIWRINNSRSSLEMP